MFIKKTLIFLFACSLAGAAENASDHLTLRDVFNLAKVADPNIRKANSRIHEMSENGTLARSGYFPALTLQSTIITNQLLFTQKIWDGGATLAASKVASEEEKIATSEKRSETRKLYFLVAEAYYDALFAMQKINILTEDETLVNSAIAYSEKQLKYRAIGRNVLLKAKVAQRKANADLFEANNQKNRAAHVLSRLTHKEDFQLNYLEGKLDPDALAALPNLDSQKLVEDATNQSPDILTLKSRSEAEIARKNYTLAEDRLQLSFIAAYGVGQSNPPRSIYNAYQNDFHFGAFINFPLFSGFSSFAKKRISEERTVQIDQDLVSTRSTIDFETKELLSQMKQDANDIQALKKEITYSQQIWSEVDSEYRLGLSNPDLWFDSLSNLETWKLQRLAKTRDYMIKHANLVTSLESESIEE